MNSMDAEAAKAMLADVKEKYGRDIRVFETSTTSHTPNEVSNSEETDDFYEFTQEDYFRMLTTKKEDKYLKTRKIREAEDAARRSRITKAVIRVRFPDNYTLEATFHPSEKIQSLIDLLTKVVAHPELPFYIYTTPPKKRLQDMSQDFYSACFIPGAILYFSYDLPEGEGAKVSKGPYLKEDIVSLRGLEFDLVPQQAEPEQSGQDPVTTVTQSSLVHEDKPADKKPVKPKWLKM